MQSFEPFLLQAHSDLTDDVIFAYHIRDKKLLYLNKAFENIWHLKREAVLADASLLIETVPYEDRLLVVNILSSIGENPKQKIELRLHLPDQSEKWINIKASLTQQGDEDIIVGTVTDISALKDYSNTLYKFANKKNSILEILSHDLVSPLANIQMCTKALQSHTKASGDVLADRMLNLITDNSTRSIKMIRDLVNRELLESSEAPLIFQRTDLIRRIGEVIEQYKHNYQTVKQSIQLVSDKESLYVTIDETKFMQVINNLLSNALKFTRDEDEIKLIVEESETTVFIKVQDTGVGIPVHLQPFIFDKFTKARREGIHGEPTTGLGLSIIKTIVEWHDGHIWFESAEGKGTTFFIEMPKNP